MTSNVEFQAGTKIREDVNFQIERTFAFQSKKVIIPVSLRLDIICWYEIDHPIGNIINLIVRQLSQEIRQHNFDELRP